MIPRLLEKYRNNITPSLMQKFNFKNRFQVPRLEKIVLNAGVGAGAHDIRILEQVCAELALIAGQRPIITKARKSISNFKIRKGSPIGCKVTLRGFKMYEFLDRLISVALPRIRDFRGLRPNSFDGVGNYSIGLEEQTIFPEINIDKVQRLQGLSVTIVTTAKTRKEAFELLQAFGLPFRE
jgi:large subunit ribosomal protein L5